MRAIVQERYGPPDDLQLREVPPPVPGAGEVLVRVRAASLHPDVWHVVTGWPRMVRVLGAGLTRPRRAIPGTDMSGVVEAVGEGAEEFTPGEEVFGETVHTEIFTNGGAFAEYVAVPEELLVRKPRDVSHAEAATVPTAGYIAIRNLRDPERMGPGRRVLVNGAGGGVGSIVLQIAKVHGARVSAVDATGKLDLLRTLGADEVIDFTREDFTRGDGRYDFVFDVVGNRRFSVCRRVLEPDGRYVLLGYESYGTSGRPVLGVLPYLLGLMVRSRFVRQLRPPPEPLPPRREAMTYLAGLLAAGKLTPIVDRTYELADFREAFARLVGGQAVGRVLLEMR